MLGAFLTSVFFVSWFCRKLTAELDAIPGEMEALDREMVKAEHLAAGRLLDRLRCDVVVGCAGRMRYTNPVGNGATKTTPWWYYGIFTCFPACLLCGARTCRLCTRVWCFCCCSSRELPKSKTPMGARGHANSACPMPRKKNRKMWHRRVLHRENTYSTRRWSEVSLAQRKKRRAYKRYVERRTYKSYVERRTI